jgi:signal peptidase II
MTGRIAAGSGGRPRWAIFLGLAIGVVVLDQLTKAWLVANVDPGEIVVVLGDWLRLVHGQNTGAIFGLFRDSAILFAAVSLVVIGLIVAFQARSRGDPILAAALGLLMGGAIGNLVDRLRYGYVVDFVDIGLGDWRFYTFNVADASISLAILLLLIRAVWPAPQPSMTDG